MTTGHVRCTKCGEDNPSLISEIKDPMGLRYYCAVCANEFRIKGLNAPPVPVSR